MKWTRTQYKKLKELMPIARKLAKISNCKFMCAMLYIIENGCKWRALPKKYGNWHTIYMRFSRLAKNCTIAKAVAFFNPNFRSCESIHSKNNNCLLMDRAYEDDKTLTLAKDGFDIVVPPKKKS